MLTTLFDPLTVGFVQRALWGGIILSALCALVGVWVIARGLTFLGEAMGHAMLPGVAIASLLGIELVVGAAASAVVMVLGVEAIRSHKDFGRDTSIGLLLVGLLAVGVIIVSYSSSFATDLTAFLFGDVLAIDGADLLQLAVLTALVLLVNMVFYRSFLAVTFDERKARTLGVHPVLTNMLMVLTLAVAMAGAFSVVGTLLAFGMLVAPSATALLIVRRVPVAMVVAFAFGSLSTFIGLLISWHASTAGGATIATTAVSLFFLTLTIRTIRRALNRSDADGRDPDTGKEIPQCAVETR
ncbi:zinc ABC transporter permease AztB [Gordonia sp. PKS22-38]|uniref:Zinc ABC transporter permease AztB n=1 Tax=Gordonia prachuapensis TaxID=3115651 RepID=A0ABU7MMZ0_9ACTN|nr:zinc ABC transporter permease AztB [Gordonia sp. PKS22-38]